MEDLKLTDTELRYFGDLFLLCADPANRSYNRPVANPGSEVAQESAQTVPIVRACELFRTSKLSNETVRQITELSSNGASTEMGRREFYTALRLIAAAQSGKSVTENSHMENNFTEGAAILPKFTWPADEESTTVSSAVGDSRSPDGSSTTSDSPTPTNSVQERNWIPDAASEEQRQLLGTEEESSDRHSSEEEKVIDGGLGDLEATLWTITPEQREYYTNQFKALQPQSGGFLVGHRARHFFEKSRLPVQELRQIWQLADVSKDGALSLTEFNVAMHLVVLRRNGIPLPESLPPSLHPNTRQPPSKSPTSSTNISHNPSPPASSTIVNNKQWTKFSDSPTPSSAASVASPGPKPVNFDFHKSAVEQDPKILHPVPLRVTPDAPHTNLDQESTEAVSRKSMENQQTSGTVEFDVPQQPNRKSLLPAQSLDSAIQRPQPRKQHHGHHGPHALPGAIPPPPVLPFDDQSGPTSLPVVSGGGPRGEPPPPPPRPNNNSNNASYNYNKSGVTNTYGRTHARSSSLDLTRFQQGGNASLLPPPLPPPHLPPRASPSTTPPRLRDTTCLTLGYSGIFGGAEDEGIAEVDTVPAPRRFGAFQVYRKHHQDASPPSLDTNSQNHGNTNHDSLRKLESQNSALTRLCLELNQDLLQLQEHRTQLQLRLDQLQARYDL